MPTSWRPTTTSLWVILTNYHHRAIIIILIYFVSFGRSVVSCNSITLSFSWLKPYSLREISKVGLSKYINITKVMMMLKSSFYKPKWYHNPSSVNWFLSSLQSLILLDLWQFSNILIPVSWQPRGYVYWYLTSGKITREAKIISLSFNLCLICPMTS